MTEIIHKELSYSVRGVLFDVYNQLGPMLPERFYQEAIAVGLEAEGIACQTEKQFDVQYLGVEVGRYYVDVWIDSGKLLLELKVAPEISSLHRAQAISYLKVTDADLAVVVNFGAASLEDERLPNRLRHKKDEFVWPETPPAISVPYPELVDRIVKVLHRVHFELGPGFLHQVYRRATMVELRQQEIGYRYIKQMPVYYHGTHLGIQETRLILVEGCILLATVAVREVEEAMKARLRARLRRQNVELGLLANFNGVRLDISLVRNEYNESK